MVYASATEPVVEVSVDYSGFHGPVASAMVIDCGDLCQEPFYQELVLIGHNECESDWHDETCDCPTDDYYKQVFVQAMMAKNYAIVREVD